MLRILLLLMSLVIAIVSGCGMNQSTPEDGSYKKQLTEPELSVYMHKSGITEKLKLEKYLEGVVAGEMRNDWDINALAAQAIIARTFTLQAFEKGNLTSQGTNASTDIQEFQAYNAAAVNERVKQAVEMTRGKIAVYQGIPIMGWFHASAGGKTALAKEGLDYKYEEPPFIQSVTSPDQLAPAELQQWTAVYSLEEVLTGLNKLDVNVTQLNQIRKGRQGISGRTETIIINDDVEVSAPRLRLALGSTKLKSMLLDTLALQADKVIFQGNGYGHGVGMSQWGAQKLAIDGKSPDDIIKFYFKDIVIEKRW